MKQYFVLGILMSLLVACGDGGGSSSGGSSRGGGSGDIAYILPDFTTKPTGSMDTFNINGQDSAGTILSGTLKYVSVGPVLISGINYLQYDTLLSLATGTTTVSNYLDPTTRDLAYIYDSPAGISARPTLTARLPQTAYIGDSGDLPSLSWSNGYTETASWKLEASATPSQADFVETYITKDGLGNTTSIQVDTFTIDAAGDVKLYKIHVDSYFLNVHYTIDLSGTKA